MIKRMDTHTRIHGDTKGIEMFCLRHAILNIGRHKQKSILVVLICALIVFFVYMYIDNIRENREQLTAISQAIPVTAQIRNLDGSQETGLAIKEELIDQIEDSGYVKDLFYTAQMAANFSSIPDEENQLKAIAVRAVNDAKAIPYYEKRKIQMTDTADADFLHGSDALCLANEPFLQAYGLSVGDTAELNLYAMNFDILYPTFSYVSLGQCSLRIVGIISSDLAGDSTQMDLVCPVGWARERYREADMRFDLDSVSFTVADPLKLNECKAAMKEIGLLSVSPTSDFSLRGNALSVRDEVFIKSGGRIKSNLNVLNAFAPVIFIVIALTGYAVSYLLMQSRRADIAVMRSLGASRKMCMTVMFLEYAALGLTGFLLGIMCSVAWTGSAGIGPLLIALLFFVSFLLGIVGAAYQISRRNTMSGLVKVEA
jgi:hypothetical protein